MTGLGVERVARTACPPPSVRPTDVSPSLPPLIQKAERRRSRWGLRLLVVGGLAGAAWLLTGAAAHAADRSDEPTGSLLGAVVGSDATAPVSGLLTAAAQPLEAVPAHHKNHVVADLLDVPKRVLTRPAETLSEVTHGSTGTTVDAATGGVDAVLREVAGPLRLTGGPADTPQRIIAAVTDTADIPDARPIKERPQVPAVTPDAQVAPEIPVAPETSAAPANPAKISTALRAPIADAVRAGAVARHVKAAPHHIGRRHRTTAPAAAAEQASAGGDAPGGDGSARWQLHLGDVSGTSTSGSGTPTEGGSAAFLPAAIVNSAMACHRLPIVSDVEVRRHDAEAPTVSPD